MKEGYYKGLFAEFLASIYLTLKGYRIIKHRYSNYCGEIDFVCIKNNFIVFVEVKYRKTSDNIEEVITSRQKSRIRRAAEIFMARYPLYDARFDAIFISYPRIDHIKNAF